MNRNEMDLSGVSDGWSVASSVDGKPAPPFLESGSIKAYYDNGGTARGYEAIMCSYYAACSSATPVGVVSRGRSWGRAHTIPSPVSSRGSSWAAKFTPEDAVSTALVGLDPPGMPSAEFFSLCAAKQSLIESYGDGYCYLYAIRKECIPRVADQCGTDCEFERLLGCSADFESDAFLALLRVEVDGLRAHVDPASGRGTRFLTLCRALRPGIAPLEFERRMKMYKPSAAGSVVVPGLTLGTARATVPTRRAGHTTVHAFYHDHSLKVVVPSLASGPFDTPQAVFTETEARLGYQGLVVDRIKLGVNVFKAPAGFASGFAYCPSGLEIGVRGNFVSGPCVFAIEPEASYMVNVLQPLASLWLNVITDVRPHGVRPREPGDVSEDVEVAKAFRAYALKLGGDLGRVQVGRGFWGVGPEIATVVDDGTQDPAVARKIGDFIRNSASASVMASSWNAVVMTFARYKLSKGGLACVVTVAPRDSGANLDQFPDVRDIDGTPGYRVATCFVMAGSDLVGGKLTMVGAVAKCGGVVAVSYELVRGSGRLAVSHRFDVEYGVDVPTEKVVGERDKMVLTGCVVGVARTGG